MRPPTTTILKEFIHGGSSGVGSTAIQLTPPSAHRSPAGIAESARRASRSAPSALPVIGARISLDGEASGERRRFCRMSSATSRCLHLRKVGQIDVQQGWVSSGSMSISSTQAALRSRLRPATA